MNRITIAIVDDKNIRQMLSIAINSISEFEVFGTYKNGIYFINTIIAGQITLWRKWTISNAYIRESCRQIKTIMLSQHTEERIIANMINARTAAYLDKGCKQEELFLAIQAVYKTGYYMNALTLKSLARKFNHASIAKNLPEHVALANWRY